MNILITGCSRGIGRGFLAAYLKRAEESVTGMMKKIDALKNTDTGGFLITKGIRFEW